MKQIFVALWIFLCCSSCGISKQQATINRDYSLGFLKTDSLFSRTKQTNIEDLIHRGVLKANIYIRTFSSPDSLGVQHLLTETGIDLSMSGETKERRESSENNTSGGGSLNTGYKSGNETVEETKDIDRRPFRIPGWVWWTAGAIGAGVLVFKAKDWVKKLIRCLFKC
ncbi:MAG: hypothetical protein LBU37_02665 [Tannerellaceae bacterium]|jgi:hypothetical protein|nr:hypothetical protein [Tannerellaceae bacterium]